LRPGSRPFWKLTGSALAALALAFACGAARAQEYLYADGLRADSDDASMARAVPTDETSDPTADTDRARPPKKPKANAKGAKSTDPRLPPVRLYKGAQRADLRGGLTSPGFDGAPPPGPTTAALPTPPPRRKIPVEQEKPYDPVGTKVGDLVLKPYIEEDVGYASNPSQVAGPTKGSAFSTTEVGASLQSDWTRDDLHGVLKGGYTDYFAAPEDSAPFGSGALDGRYDVSKALSFDGEGRFNVANEPQSALGITGSKINQNTLVSTYGASVGAAQKFGDLTLALHGSFDRTTYQEQGVAAADSLSTDDYNDWGVKARASYRLSDAVSPFLELGADTRVYDHVVDATGYERDSNGVTAMLGMTLAYSKMLTGEVSVGYGAREYQDPKLPNASAPLLNASLIWAATPLTTITLKTQSSLQDAVLAGASADINRSYTIDVSHALTRQIKLGVTAGLSTDAYVGVSLKDTTLTLGANVEYALSRDVVLKASATRQQFTSSATNSNYVANVFLLGLRLQE